MYRRQALSRQWRRRIVRTLARSPRTQEINSAAHNGIVTSGTRRRTVVGTVFWKMKIKLTTAMTAKTTRRRTPGRARRERGCSSCWIRVMIPPRKAMCALGSGAGPKPAAASARASGPSAQVIRHAGGGKPSPGADLCPLCDQHHHDDSFAKHRARPEPKVSFAPSRPVARFRSATERRAGRGS
jgi:hypothetical protein